ncbi:MAG: mechanosensitive ion channel domain-containing protein [Synechococcales bacterium]|nr:mechanosensitive ion channel domain-containing protein [Synechococcales bacterium]
MRRHRLPRLKRWTRQLNLARSPVIGKKRSPRLGHHWSWLGPILTALLVLLLTMAGLPAQSQGLHGAGGAPVVVDGRVVFEVKDTGTITAEERARWINQELEQEVRSPQPVDIVVAQKDGLVYLVNLSSQVNLRNRPGDGVLITVTEADITPPRQKTYEQAVVWAKLLETALRRGQLERQPSYLRRALAYSGIVFLGAIAVHLMLQFAGRAIARYLDQWLRHSAHSLNPWERSLRLFWQLGVLGIQAGLWLTVGFYITDTIPQARSWRYKIYNLLNARIFDLGSGNYSALELLLFLALAIALWFLVSVVVRLFRLYVLSRAGVERRVQDILSVLLQYALAFLGVIILLQIWGIDVSSLAILASVLGVGLGFGVQNITNNFISGFIITLERPVQVGDFINVGELVGTVERIGARSTEIRTLDQVAIIVPNSRFLENEVINWSHGDPVSRLHLPVGVAYGSNIEQVKRALLEAVKRHPEVLLQPRPEVWFQGFGDSALNFEVLVWTGEPRKQFRVKSDLYYEIEASLRRYDINVPFPQRDVHLRSPNLDELLITLKQSLANGTNGHLPPSPSVPPPLPANWLANLNLAALVDAMQGDGGVQVGDRRYRFNIYPICFTGGEAVEWLVQHRGYTREEAIGAGQVLLDQGFIHAVTEASGFQDGYYFYRFDRDEQQLAQREGWQKDSVHQGITDQDLANQDLANQGIANQGITGQSRTNQGRGQLDGAPPDDVSQGSGFQGTLTQADAAPHPTP